MAHLFVESWVSGDTQSLTEVLSFLGHLTTLSSTYHPVCSRLLESPRKSVSLRSLSFG